MITNQGLVGVVFYPIGFPLFGFVAALVWPVSAQPTYLEANETDVSHHD
jgi:hypothetical protein